ATPSLARPMPMLPAKPPIARTKVSAFASEVRGRAGVISPPIRPATRASITVAAGRARAMLDHGIAESCPDRTRFVGAVAHPQAERRQVRVPNADPDADRAFQQGIGPGQHPCVVLTVVVGRIRAVE